MGDLVTFPPYPAAYDQTTWNGYTFDYRSVYLLQLAEKIAGRSFTYYQGSYNAGGVASSAGTHDGGGAVDLWDAQDPDQVVTILRRLGWAAWHRTVAQGFDVEHIHAVDSGNAKLSDAAKEQVVAYNEGYDGLADYGPDDGPRITLVPRKYPPVAQFGSTDWSTATEIYPLSVSTPTPWWIAKASIGGPTSSAGYLYWKFVPERGGRISFDALLSYYTDSTVDYDPVEAPSITLTVYTLEYDRRTASNFLNFVESSNAFSGGFGIPDYHPQGRSVVEVKEGKTYIISLWYDDTRNPAPGVTDVPLNLVLRVSDYAPPDTAWVQPPDNNITWSGDQLGSVGTWNYVTDSKVLNGDNGSRVSEYHNVGFHGYSRTDRALYGPEPHTLTDAISCIWNWARKLSVGSFYWSPGNGASWDGGPGTCPVISAGPRQCQQTYGGHPVGYEYNSSAQSTWWDYQDSEFDVFACMQIIRVKSIIDACGQYGYPQGGTPPWYPTLQGEDQIVFESPKCTLTQLKVAPDEGNGGGGYASISVNWYAGLARSNADLTDTWGPRRGNDPSLYSNINQNDWVGNTVGPSQIDGIYTQFANYAGGLGSPYDLTDKIYPAIDQENAGFDAGIWLICMPEGINNSTWPSQLDPVDVIDQWHYAYRQNQMCALLVTARPPRYKIILDPGIPDITWDDPDPMVLSQSGSGRVFR